MPSTRTVPRWLTSKATESVRQAMCSASVPAPYARGMSQPPNTTSLAPSVRWASSRGEWRMSAAGAEAGRAGALAEAGADSEGDTPPGYAAGEDGREKPYLARRAW
jgi:hypothetical protein